MHQHSQTYLELNPSKREPSTLALLAGAALALLGFWLVLVVLFSL